MGRSLAGQDYEELTFRRIFRTWWPLSFSWLLMSAEMPAISAVIARLANPEINLAAYGGVVYPISLVIEAPVVMLLASSVALSRHKQAYRRMWIFMMASGAAMTVVHALVAFTPLYYIVVERLLGVPQEIVEPARVGLMLMTPFTWGVGFRRFQQGVLIRYGYSGAVGAGTFIRLIVLAATLTLGYAIGSLPGAAVGGAAQAAGVVAEAVYAGFRVRPVLRRDLPAFTGEDPLTWRAFADFYVPLVMTSFMSFLWQPIGSASLSRMPNALRSLAVWPVLSGITFLLRSFGIAYNEVVVALLDYRRSWSRLLRFALVMTAASTLLQVILATPPVSALYFGGVSALAPELVAMAAVGILISAPLPALSVAQNLLQGTVLYSRRTRAIPEAMVAFFMTILLVMALGIATQAVEGLYVGTAGLVAASLMQAGWLWWRSRPVIRQLETREDAQEGMQEEGSTVDPGAGEISAEG